MVDSTDNRFSLSIRGMGRMGRDGPCHVDEGPSRNKTMAHITSLPVELTLKIIGHLSTSPSALCALTQVNHELYDLATPYLYSRMIKTSGSAHRRFFLTLEAKPFLATHVNVYYTPYGPKARSFSLWLMLREALLTMSNLKELILRRDSRTCLPPRFRILPRDNAPFQLERFVWGVRSWKAKQGLEFLSTQTNIQFLFWESEFAGPVEYGGTLFLQEYRASEDRRMNNEAPPLPVAGGYEMRYDTWAIGDGPEIPPPPPNAGDDEEQRARETIRQTPGIKIFRMMSGVCLPGANPYIRFQYTRQNRLEDRSRLCERGWFVVPMPGTWFHVWTSPEL